MMMLALALVAVAQSPLEQLSTDLNWVVDHAPGKVAVCHVGGRAWRAIELAGAEVASTDDCTQPINPETWLMRNRLSGDVSCGVVVRAVDGNYRATSMGDCGEAIPSVVRAERQPKVPDPERLQKRDQARAERAELKALPPSQFERDLPRAVATIGGASLVAAASGTVGLLALESVNDCLIVCSESVFAAGVLGIVGGIGGGALGYNLVKRAQEGPPETVLVPAVGPNGASVRVAGRF